MVMAPLLVVNVNCACTSTGSASHKPSVANSAGRTRLRIEAPPGQVNGFLMCVFMGWSSFNGWFRLFSVRKPIRSSLTSTRFRDERGKLNCQGKSNREVWCSYKFGFFAGTGLFARLWAEEPEKLLR